MTAEDPVALPEPAGVVTIEGNTHKDYDPGRFWEGYGVFRRHHRAGQPAIRGYARPPYGR